MRNIGHFIDGKETQGASGRFGDVFNPATGEVESRVALASAADLDAAVKKRRLGPARAGRRRIRSGAPG